MMDFNKLRTKQNQARQIAPLDIFRHLPKLPCMNDLYTSKAEVLESRFVRRVQRDKVVNP
jgi:hypothetical protein